MRFHLPGQRYVDRGRSPNDHVMMFAERCISCSRLLRGQNKAGASAMTQVQTLEFLAGDKLILVFFAKTVSIGNKCSHWDQTRICSSKLKGSFGSAPLSAMRVRTQTSSPVFVFLYGMQR